MGARYKTDSTVLEKELVKEELEEELEKVEEKLEEEVEIPFDQKPAGRAGSCQVAANLNHVYFYCEFCFTILVWQYKLSHWAFFCLGVVIKR